MAVFPRAKSSSGPKERIKRRYRLNPRLEPLEQRQLLTYLFTSLDVPGATRTTAYGLNNSGEIVGYYADATGRYHGYVKDSVGYTTLTATSLGAANTYSQGINDAGQIVGTYNYQGSDGRGFLLNAGGYSTIDPPGGPAPPAGNHANGINNAGQIVGSYSTAAILGLGYFKDGNTLSVIDASSLGGVVTTAWSINDAGQIVGSFSGASGPAHGFLEENGNYKAIDATSLGATDTLAYGINSGGLIVGEYYNASHHEHGFLDNGGTYATIDFPGSTATRVLGINSAGQLVGSYVDASAHTHGFLATPQKTDLAATSLTWDTKQGAVDYTYTISGADLPQPTNAAFYLSTDTSLATGQHVRLNTPPISTATQAGTSPYTGSIDVSALGTPPTGADFKYLLFVVNPDSTPTESDGPDFSDPNSDNVKAVPIPLPDLAATSLTWDTAQGGVDYGYTINGGALSQDVPVALYWSSSTAFKDQLGKIDGTDYTISAGTAGNSSYRQHVDGTLLTGAPEGTKYVLVVVGDPNKGNFNPTTGVYSLQDVQLRGSPNPAFPLSDTTTGEIQDLLRESGNSSATVTSTVRTPSQQASAMYTNIRKKGVASQRRLYKRPGRAVINVYVRMKADGVRDRTTIINAMANEIVVQGPYNVSHHCADAAEWETLQVLDIAPKSLQNPGLFAMDSKQDRADGILSQFLDPSKGDPAYHLEVPQ